MRAFDALYVDEETSAPGDATRLHDLTDSIIRLRREIWWYENSLFCSVFVSGLEVETLEQIRSGKRSLLTLLDVRVANWGIESVPRRLGTQGATWSERLEDWWEQWEEHPDHITPREPTPWDPHRIPQGREPAPTRPVVPPTLRAALQRS